MSIDEEYFKDLTLKDRVAIGTLLDLGGFDGGHHKQYALDQVLRVLTDCPEVERTAKNYLGNEYAYIALGESKLYKRVVAEFKNGEDGPETYEWDEGIAP